MLFELGAKRFNDIAAEAGIVKNKEERKSEEPRESALEPVQEQSKEGDPSLDFEPMIDHNEI